MNTFSCPAAMRSLAMLALAFGLSGPGCGSGSPSPHPAPHPAARAAPPTEADRRAADEALPSVSLSPAFPRLTFNRPVAVTHADDGTDRLFVTEQRGRIRVFPPRSDVTTTEEFLDISDRVRMRDNEEGLLDLAFHPRYTENGELFIYYTASSPRRGVLARFRVDANDPDRADPTSEEIILEVEQPYGNHNGATVVFGPDGYLYLSLGDGGYANDPHGHGQNLGTLLGTVLRIDVDHKTGDRAYAIPPENPFVNRTGATQIWAYGLRNVWRMSFDSETGELWAGDVGQNRWEEVDLIVKGGNYGWKLHEGLHPFSKGDADGPLIDPIVEYERKKGLSIIGGRVYRGDKYPNLVGVYLYADYVTGRIWGLRAEDGKLTAHRELSSRMGTGVAIASFGVDAEGEILVCVFDKPDGRKGRVMRLRASGR